MTVAQRLHEAVAAVCPIHGVRITAGTTGTADYNNASPEQITAAEGVIAAFDWSQETHAAWVLVKERARAKSEYDAHRVFRAMATLLVNELNSHAATIASLLDAIDAASSLATLKTAVATIANPPQRTLNQVVTALKNHIDADA